MIKSIVNNNTVTPVHPFPKLMILTNSIDKDDPMIVLFKKSKEGTVLTKTSGWSIGDRDSDFAMHNFSEYHGTIQLENGA
jgi:hypothetical protein